MCFTFVHIANKHAYIYIYIYIYIVARTSIIRHARQYMILTGRANTCSCAYNERQKKLLATEAIEKRVAPEKCSS